MKIVGEVSPLEVNGKKGMKAYLKKDQKNYVLALALPLTT